MIRLPSEVLRARWPFEGEARFAAYIDVAREGAARVELFDGLVPALLDLSRAASDAQRAALETAVAGVREVAIGADERGWLVLARFDAAIVTEPLGMARALVGPRELEVAVVGDLLVIGAKSLVAAALAADARGGASLATLAMTDDARLAFTAHVRDLAVSGTVAPSRERLVARIAVQLESAETRAQLERQLTGLTAPMPAGGDELAAKVARYAKGLSFESTARGVDVTYVLEGPPLEQASDLTTLAALYQRSVRMYLRQVKLVEARVALPIVARACVELREKERTLRSFPAVPAVMPSGAAHTPVADEWAAWSPLYFEYQHRHWFQLEVRAAADGASAEIIAQSDLDGDGRRTVVRLVLTVDHDAGAVHIGELDERDPGEPLRGWLG